MAEIHLKEAIEASVDYLVTSCPLCHLNLDSLQPAVEKVIEHKLNLSVLHLTQLVALVLGINRTKLGLYYHAVSTRYILKSLTYSMNI
jgi:succinate dehydrogenase / fumarate reductase, cytochrome b subunit